MHLHQPTKQDQSGFGAIEVLLVFLVVAALAVTGFVVYQRHKIGIKNTVATNSSKTSTTAQSAQTSTQYLTIKEWGVRLKLNSDTASLYYYIKPNLPDVAYLSLKGISDIAPNCAADKTSLGAIVRLTPAEQQSAPDAKYRIKGTIQIGNHWYGYDNSHAACTDGTAAMEAAVSKAIPNFNVGTLQDTFRTLEDAPAQYLTIPEWGVRAPYSGSLKLSYTMSSDRRTATFSSDQLTALSSACTGRGGFIIRWASTDQVSEGPPDANTPTAEQAFAGKDPSTVPYAHIGNYYYTFAHDQAACGDLNTTAALQSQTNDAVKALVPNLQAIPD